MSTTKKEQMEQITKPVLGRYLILLIIVGLCFLSIPESENQPHWFWIF
jgi:hypothetical protein